MEDAMLKRVVDVEYIKDYTLRIEFNDRKVKTIDFLPLLKGKLFEPLKDKNKFIQYGLTHWTIEWYNGAEISPEILYNL
jgi:hypothetical protein